MRVALARHDTLLERAIKAGGGHIFKRGGDSFVRCFAAQSDALIAALAAQRALCAEPWPADATIRVAWRCTRAAQLRDGDYFGAPLNRVARLMAAAHGGQTLVSDEGYDAARTPSERSPPEASRRPHAEGCAGADRGIPALPSRFAGVLPGAHRSAIDNTQSIAVLPFVNLSREEENEYFADGLAEELLNVLAKIRGLRVAARSSAFTFKGKGASVAEVGSALNVATVLEGTVRNAGNAMRISVQLVKVADGFDIWSASYDRTLEDIFAVQDDIAQCVVKELRRTLLGEAIDANAATQVTAQIAAAVKAEPPMPRRIVSTCRRGTSSRATRARTPPRASRISSELSSAIRRSPSRGSS
jgi:TolB-like protein